MITGLLLMLLTGLLWVVLGAIISRTASKNLDLEVIQVGAALMIATISILYLLFLGKFQFQPVIMICLPIAGFGNYLTFILMKNAMTKGPNGIVWSVIQSAFVIPFGMGIIFFNVLCTLYRIAGIVLLLLSVYLSGRYGKNNAGETNKGWLIPTFIAFAMAGISQCAANLPSYFVSGGFNSLITRITLSSFGTIVGFILHSVTTHKKWHINNTLKLIPIFATATCFASLILYNGLDILATHKVGAIGYPIALGSCILLFYIYSITVLREKFRFSGAVILTLCLSGILLISLK